MQQEFRLLYEQVVTNQGEPGDRGRARPPPRASSRRRIVLAGFALAGDHLLMEDPEHLRHDRSPPTSHAVRRTSPNDGFSLVLEPMA